MRGSLRASLFLFAMLATTTAAGAQTRIGFRSGVTTSSRLVRDSAGTETIESRVNPAAFVAAVIDTRVRSDIWLGASVSVGRSNLVRRIAGESTAIARLTILHPSVSVGYPLTSWLEGHARIGALIYRPDRQLGTIFRESAPTTMSYGALLSASRTIRGRLTASLDLGYDYHRFGTTTLRAAGFVGETSVHRLTIGVTVRHQVRSARP